MFHVIMAGGSGTRFWPWSSDKKPKQLLNIYEKKTMIRGTVNRIKEIDGPDKIFIIAKYDLLNKIKEEIPEIPNKNFILEPSAKNTAPAIGLCAIHLLKIDEDEVMAVYPSDHYIGGKEFRDTINRAKKFASKNSGLITIGVKPTYPATGYGYIHIDKKINDELKIYEVNRFIEKPDEEIAKSLLSESGNYWNSGIFIWSIKSIINSIEKHMPDLHQSLLNIGSHIDKTSYSEKLNLYWDNIISESIDYGILEKEKYIYLVIGKFIWNDLGSWKSLYNLLVENNKDTTQGNIVSIDSSNNLIISPNRLTAAIGLENMVIININNSTLIMPIEHSEKVKDIVGIIKNNSTK